jgi:hypothetical protein
MKKSLEIPAHLILWILFAVTILINSHLFLEAKPGAAFSQHFTYVVFLDIVIGAAFFYITYVSLPWAGRTPGNSIVFAAIMLLLLILFAIPAFKIGIWQVLSSIVPHTIMILLAVIFRNLFRTNK